MLSKVIFKLGSASRNPSLFQYCQFLQNSDFWSKEELDNYQLKKAKTFLEFVSTYSQYYRDMFLQADFRPQEIETIEDLKKIPVIDKASLREFSDRIHTSFTFKKKFFSRTT